MATTFERNHITRLENILDAYATAVLEIVQGQVAEYQLDTGQGRQRVTRHDLPKMQETYGLLWQQYDALVARCGTGGTIQIVPPGALPWQDRI